VPNERTAADRLKAYAEIETEQSHNAREAADAIFKPRQQAAVVEEASGETGATAPLPQQPVRTPRILSVQQLEPEPTFEPKVPAKSRRLASQEQVPEIPLTEYHRIRTLADYGMTIKEIAEVYGVGVRKIEHIASKAMRAR
jgi:hypothetical protein